MNVIIAFDPHSAPEARRRVLQEVGVSDAPGPTTRWHGSDLITARSPYLGPSVLSDLRADPAVRQVVRLEEGQLLSRSGGPLMRSAHLGLAAGGPALIAGPCSVEGRTQLLETADAVAAGGATALRGGCFKARSSPYSFGGLGEAGLELLVEARQRTGLPFVTEPLDVDQLDTVARYADAIQIGSRNMQNYPLLFAAGAHTRGLPILLKRGLAATVDELLLAAEYVLLGRLAAGRAEAGLILCERGIRTFERSTRFTLDVASIAVLQERCDLPIIVDPSHAAGRRALVAPLALAALAAGAEGLLVEVHPEPEQAWCDGPQSLSLSEYAALTHGIDAMLGASADFA